jgi:hypothetical protein
LNIFVLDGKREVRYIREIIYGKKRKIQYWEIRTDRETQSEAESWFVMTYIPEIKYQEVGAIYGIRTWVEYGLKQCKSELGWADFRVTHYEQIQKWWELVMSAYLMICLHSDSLNPLVIPVEKTYQTHELWNETKGWKNWLNNLRLILQPFISFNFILKWLKVFPIPPLTLGFPMLIAKMNEVDCLRYLVYFWDDFYYSSA